MGIELLKLFISLVIVFSSNYSNVGIENNLIGTWAMQPLVNGIANVVIFKEGGESIVYPFVCSWKDGGYSSSLPSEATYRVNKENKTIVVTDELGVLELKVLESGSNSMLVEHLSYGLQFKYYKVKDVEPLCDLR